MDDDRLRSITDVMDVDTPTTKDRQPTDPDSSQLIAESLVPTPASAESTIATPHKLLIDHPLFLESPFPSTIDSPSVVEDSNNKN